MTFLRAVCVLMVLSGIAGVFAGELSAGGGWWLIIVFGVLLLLTYAGGRLGGPSTDQRSVRRRHRWLVTAGLAFVVLVVVAPIAFVMLLGGG